MPPLKLRMTCGPYDRAQALIDGSVRPDGIDLAVTVDSDDVARQRRIERGEFDAAEFFTGTYIADLPRKALGLTAIPVFVKRMFRHSYIYINTRRGIRTAPDLNGRRIFVQNWLTTAALWGRAILEEDGGVDLESVRWVQGRPASAPGWTQPQWLRLETNPEDPFELLASGAIDAAISTETWAPGRHPDVDFLFPDYARREREYFVRTRCFPIMHTLVVKTSVLEQHPWVARSLYDAWEESKQRCYRHLDWQRVHMTSMWYRALWEEERAAAGADIYPWGYAKTRDEVERMLRHAHRQGFTPRQYEPQEMFWPTMLGT